MEDARKKIRMFLVIVVALAVLTGLVYYFSDAGQGEDLSEGTLVKYTTEIGLS